MTALNRILLGNTFFCYNIDSNVFPMMLYTPISPNLKPKNLLINHMQQQIHLWKLKVMIKYRTFMTKLQIPGYIIVAKHLTALIFGVLKNS